MIALVGNCLPFWFISWGQQHIDSALAGVRMDVMPPVTLMLAHRFAPGERMTLYRFAGFMVGFPGIVRLSLVNYLVPCVALGAAVAFMGETRSASADAGLMLIRAGHRHQSGASVIRQQVAGYRHHDTDRLQLPRVNPM